VNDCLLCDKRIATPSTWKALIGIDKKPIICINCSKRFKHADINKEHQNLDDLISLYAYNEAMKDYLHQYKFLQDVALSAVFADDLRRVLKSKKCIIPIPMHAEKKIKRTFSPVEELLHSARIPYEALLEKKNTESMGEKSRAQRLEMAPLFTIKPTIIIEPKTYILLDDIYTTGTTLQHAATLLKEAGAKRVEAVTLIRA